MNKKTYFGAIFISLWHINLRTFKKYTYESISRFLSMDGLGRTDCVVIDVGGRRVSPDAETAFRIVTGKNKETNLYFYFNSTSLSLHGILRFAYTSACVCFASFHFDLFKLLNEFYAVSSNRVIQEEVHMHFIVEDIQDIQRIIKILEARRGR